MNPLKNQSILKKTSFYSIRKIKAQKTEDLYSLGYMYYERGNFKEAIIFFVIISRYCQLEKRSWMGLAATFEQARIYEKSISSYREVVLLNPKNSQTYFYISLCYQLLGNKTEAEKFSEKAFQKISTGIKI